ncbi:hypothetical protein Hypma_000142 [Hypsizygus marmoreus]|uniref:Uncharacterized protein n=1 Tax=Hypsizygus marmoreus TaxID=39966 RepID=A0A369K8X2_HYPMA|nr:hypothetical protein Hypma_000142 [Hypsizygus marmoreus]
MPGPPPISQIISALQHRDVVLYFNIALSIYHGSAPNLSPSYCRRNYYATIYLDRKVRLTLCLTYSSSFILSLAAILTFRTWAIWSRDKRLGAAMAIVFTAFFASSATFASLFLKGMQFGTLPIPHFPGCFITGGNSYLTGSWVLLMVYDAWMMSMMLFPAVRTYKQGGSNTLLRTVYRDGILYYLYLFVFSFLNAVFALALPHDLSFVLTLMERVMHSTLTSRVVLQIRAEASRDHIHIDNTNMEPETLMMSGLRSQDSELRWKVADVGIVSKG